VQQNFKLAFQNDVSNLARVALIENRVACVKRDRVPDVAEEGHKTFVHEMFSCDFANCAHHYAKQLLNSGKGDHDSTKAKAM